jgi:hypothetical protein
MDAWERRGRVRDVLLGGVLGASAAIAAARRRRPRGRSRQTPMGLTAFEDAPCYRETMEREAVKARARE